MEKLEINNEILTLKREMKIGRVYLLRRLIAQVKKLEKAKGTDEQRGKRKQKAERWMQQVKVLQKANLNSLARKVIVSEECWQKVISEPKSTLEERALARLLNLKKVQDFVGSFRAEHPDWKSWVPQLVEMWDEKKARRLSYKSGGPTGANASEIGGARMEKMPAKRRRLEKVEKPSSRVGDAACDADDSERDDDNDEVASDTDDSTEEEVDDAAKDTSSSEDDGGEIEERKAKAPGPKTTQPALAKLKRPPEKMVQKQCSKAKPAAFPPARTAASAVVKEAPRMSTKMRGSVLVAPVDVTQLEEEREDAQLRFASADDGGRSDDEIAEATQEPAKKRDPFFCREGDDDDDTEGDESDSGGARQQPPARERFHRDDDDGARNSGRGWHRGGGGRFSRSPRGGGFGRGGGFRGRGGFRGDSRGRGRGLGRGPGRAGFGRDRGAARGRGDETGRGGGPRKMSHDAQRESTGSRNEPTDGPVHPSWAARQQQKAKLANLSAFQGKKITFD